MNKICTSIEQSKKLLELGIDVNTADMYYDVNSYGIQSKPEVAVGKVWNKDIPAWSLSALLDILPNNEHIGTSVSRGSWQIDPIKYLPNTWWCEYEDSKSLTEFNISAENPVDACVKMIIKLHEMNLL